MEEAIVHKENLNPHKIKVLNILTLFLGFSESLCAYIMSSYFKEVIGSDNVSIFYLLAYLFILLSLVNLHKLIKRIGKTYTYFIFLVGQILVLMSLIFLPINMIGALFLVFGMAFSNLKLVLQDSILESFSEDNISGRIRGFNLTMMNIGFLFGPYVSMSVLDSQGFKGIFMIQAAIYIIMLFIAMINLHRSNKRFTAIETTSEVLKKMWSRKDLLAVYYVAFVLDFFYAIMVPYMPLYLLERGYSLADLSKMFTVMLVPFVIMEYPLGLIVDRNSNEKKLIIGSLALMGLSTSAILFFDNPGFAAWSAILFSTRIGAASLEILRDSYFYKRIDCYDIDIIDFFRTSRPVAYIIASLISAILLLLSPNLKPLFGLIVLAMLGGIYPALHLKDGNTDVCETK